MSQRHIDPNTEPEDSLKTAYLRLQLARDNLVKIDVNTAPLKELTTHTSELQEAKNNFLEEVQRNLVEVNGHSILRHEYEALQSLAKLNGRDADALLHGIVAVKDGRITQLRIHYKGIKDISPLTRIQRLEDLDLLGNQIEDISPLAGHHELRCLRLWSNQIEDIRPLSGLIGLKELWLNNNRLVDISSLQALGEMSHVTLHENDSLAEIAANIETIRTLEEQGCTVYL
jgi:Leucine-rich repeat (LRR) protein